MTTNDWNVPVPQETLDRKPSFLMPAGWYASVLQAGSEIVGSDNNPSWKAIKVPFAGFASKKDSTQNFPDKTRDARYTIAGTDQAVQIGREQLTALAVAFGLAEDTVDAEGKPAKRMTATSPEDFVSQLNAVAGTPCDVYITVKNRKRGKTVVMKEDGSGPVQDNDIARVAAAGQGK